MTRECGVHGNSLIFLQQGANEHTVPGETPIKLLLGYSVHCDKCEIKRDDPEKVPG